MAARTSIDWARWLRDECKDYGIPFFMKQIGQHSGRPATIRHPHGGNPEEWPEDLRVREIPGDA